VGVDPFPKDWLPFLLPVQFPELLNVGRITELGCACAQSRAHRMGQVPTTVTPNVTPNVTPGKVCRWSLMPRLTIRSSGAKRVPGGCHFPCCSQSQGPGGPVLHTHVHTHTRTHTHTCSHTVHSTFTHAHTLTHRDTLPPSTLTHIHSMLTHTDTLTQNTYMFTHNPVYTLTTHLHTPHTQIHAHFTLMCTHTCSTLTYILTHTPSIPRTTPHTLISH
jgi:hypothetical protein